MGRVSPCQLCAQWAVHCSRTAVERAATATWLRARGGDTHLDGGSGRCSGCGGGPARRLGCRVAVRAAALQRVDDGVQLAHLRAVTVRGERRVHGEARSGCVRSGPGDLCATRAPPAARRVREHTFRYGQRTMPNSRHRCLSTVTQMPSCTAGKSAASQRWLEGRLRRTFHFCAGPHLNGHLVDRLVEVTRQLLQRQALACVRRPALLCARRQKASEGTVLETSAGAQRPAPHVRATPPAARTLPMLPPRWCSARRGQAAAATRRPL